MSAKRIKLDGGGGNGHHHRSKKGKKGQYNQKFMQYGQKGFILTCNFKEKECIREAYNLLNSYYEEAGEEPSSSEEVLQKEDISSVLESELIAAKKARTEKRLFQALDTQTTNCVFIKASIEDPVQLGVSIVTDIATEKVQKTKFLLRLIPVEIVCRARLTEIMEAAEPLFDKHFLKEPKTFSIVFNHRYNNDVKRDDVIRELAEIVHAKNSNNKVDLKMPQVSVIVEVIKGFCCMSVLPKYIAYKKYNLVELCTAAAPAVENADDNN